MDEFKINKVFISSFLEELWGNPEIIYYIIINSETNIVKENLAPFIVNRFFCNYLSGNYMENNLLYIITLMMKNEIDKLKNINELENFLEHSKCGYLLDELQRMPDIQIFFKNVILKTVEKIERTCSSREIKFNISEKLNELIKMKEAEERRIGKKIEKNLNEFYNKIINSKLIDESINHLKEDNNMKTKLSNDMFISKYLPELKLSDFQNRAENAKKENKIHLYEYFCKLENDIKKSNNENLYSNTIILKTIFETNISTQILTFYQNDCLKIISFVEQLIEDLINNITLLPNSIKYICKIISILIKKKFKDITKLQENAFISKFLLGKLLIPIISLPSSNALISDFVISGNTLKNIKIVNFVLKKLFSGTLFINNQRENCYTPFNWFFIDKMESILIYFEKILNINLPNFIEKLVKDELPGDYIYDYFNENNEQIYASISICFNIKNLIYLLKGLEKSNYLDLNDKRFLRLKKCFNKLKTDGSINDIKEIDKTIMNRVREKIKKKEKEKEKDKEKEKEKEQPIEIENLYLFNSQSVEKKYEYLFKINNKIADFYIDIKKVGKNKNLNEKEKNIIKVKNYLCNSLGNFRLLKKSDFDIGTTSNTVKMLQDIKLYMSLPNFILNNNTIPSVWYINSILDYLNKIPDDYKKNEYKKLFNELTQNLSDSIKTLDFEKLILFRNKLKFLDKMEKYYQNVKQLLENIFINEKIKQIVEELPIPVDIIFKYEEKEKKFELIKSNIKDKLFEDKIIYEEPKKKFISFKTIEALTRYFPNLTKYHLMQGINPFDIIKTLSINTKFNNYFDIIKEKIIKQNIIDNIKYETIYKDKIKDYIMNKLYDKIYPPEPDEIDSQLFKKSMYLSWVEPNLIVEGKDYYIYDIILPDILNEFIKIKLSKTPYKKFGCIKKILQYIVSLIQFNEGIDKTPGAEDITPILAYVFIKGHPFRIFTDIEFIKIFIENSKDNDVNLVNIESICTLILNSNYKTFNLTPEEFAKKCADAAKEINHN